ncbi:MAG: ATP-dependent DNA helicase RecG [Alphaproteobacteria bacterium MarineAlpha6_Bin3]|nr:MAG: ATP-dependent DNA helicase RecG [Alphaproteobacteria bacterium MarineAlpha6_Bin3]
MLDNITKSNLFNSIENIKGIGPKTSKLFEKLCGTKIIDLLLTMPRGIKKRMFLDQVSEQFLKEEVALIITVVKHIPQFNPRMPYKILCKNKNNEIEIIFFRGYTKYLKKILPVGENKVVCGKLEKLGSKYQIIHPESISHLDELPYLHGSLSLYSLTKGLTMSLYRKSIFSALKELIEIPEWINEAIIKKNNWHTWKETIELLHNPKELNDEKINKFKDRLSFDEALSHYIKLLIMKDKMKKNICYAVNVNNEIKNKILSDINFKLTGSQLKVLNEIENDLNKKTPMLRLLQGDVGSGKTIIALISLANLINRKMQGALMVPTEILAIQHYNYFSNMLKETNVKIALLTSKIKKKERDDIYENIENGSIQIIIGTHALFQKNVNFNNLNYIVIDEQHRFGVHQKFQLSEKGSNPHVLVMTATPIPRTLALTMYGNMNISKITELPANRTKIETRTISSNKTNKIIEGLKSIIEKKENVFWICPLIEESEKLDLTAATKRFEKLKKYFGNYVGIIHGKMDIEEKKKIIDKFKSKKILILVSTTIIEVGIDVPNATVIIIEEANRFGLSQLHQLRGRVGRSDKKSSCILLYKNKNINEFSKKRLNTIKLNNDGFKIAEEDLKLRGFGEISGTKQSGYQLFKILDPLKDIKIMEEALVEAKKIFEKRKNMKKEDKNIINIFLKIYNQSSSMDYIKIA